MPPPAFSSPRFIRSSSPYFQKVRRRRKRRKKRKRKKERKRRK
jgi:hypothetical protein